MSSPKLDISASLKILRIKQISFFVDEVNDDVKQIKSTIKIDYKAYTDMDKNAYLFTLRTTYTHPETKRMIIQSEVQNVFQIKDMKTYELSDETLKLPWDLLKEIVSLSLSHSRAILAISLAGTKYNDTLLPVFDSEAVAQQFFKKHYEPAPGSTNP